MKTSTQETLAALIVATVLGASTFALAAAASEPRLADRVASSTQLLEPGVRLQRFDDGADGRLFVFTPYPMPQGRALPLVLLRPSSSEGLGAAADYAKDGRAVVAYDDARVDVADAIAFAKAHLPIDETQVLAP
jgi:hypothetical protein